MTIQAFQTQAKAELAKLYSERESQSILRRLLGSLLQLPDWQISLHRQQKLSSQQQDFLQQALQRLLQHEPIQYILQTGPFFGRDFHLSPAVLIPRNETEELVDWMLKSHTQSPIQLLDIGTGSGCIAITLEREMQTRQQIVDCTALDISAEALEIAQRNAQTLQAHIQFQQLDILQADSQAFQQLDLIVSNPPYVLETDQARMRPNVLQYEPHTALFVPDTDALRFYRQIAKLGQDWLKTGGWLYFEIHEDKGTETLELMKEYGYKELELRKDLNGRERMIRGRK